MAARATGNLTGSASSLGKLDLGGLSSLRNLDINPSALKNLDINPSALKNLDINPSALKNLDAGGDAKKLDGVSDAAGDAKKADAVGDAKKADAAGDAKKAEKADMAMTVAGTAVIAGALVYLDDKAAEQDKKVKACIGTCLPSNWDDYEYGNLQKEELSYQTVDTIKAEFPDEEVDPKQPFCDESKEECGDFCVEKCKDLYETPLFPGQSLAARGANAAADVANTLFKPLGDMFGSVGEAMKIPCSILLVLIILFAIYYIFFRG